MSLELWKEFENCCAVTVMGESTINALSATLISSRALRGIRPYTVDRSVLRKVLVKGLEDKIQFGKKFSKYTINPDSVTITFEDGTESSGTLLVGADGGRSQIRQIFLPDFKTVDPEGICIFGKTPITDELKKRILPKALQWFVVVRDTAPVIQQVIWGSELPVSMFVEKMSFPNRSLTEMELPEDYLYWSMLLPTKLLGMTEDAVTASINRPSTEIGLDITCEWDPSLKCIIELQDPSQGAAIRIISGPPMLPEWETSDRVALIGDAIHVMAPSGGVGVATALKDASILSDKLAQGGISKSSIGAYESEMRIYAEASIRRSFAGGKLFFGQPPFDQCKEVSFKATSGEE
ncbi:putative Tetracycline resistance protein from transposon/Tn4400 [Glarea lozoyensis 74030]|nr:putative Tetracycline resistance protein from transposon/Tn4400 [Glarea lozoyensis 74030]